MMDMERILDPGVREGCAALQPARFGVMSAVPGGIVPGTAGADYISKEYTAVNIRP